LSNEKLAALLSEPKGAGIADTHRMVVEIVSHRTVRAASAVQIRTVVRAAFATVLELSGEHFAQRHIEDIATRAAKQLTAAKTTTVPGELAEHDRRTLTLGRDWARQEACSAKENCDDSDVAMLTAIADLLDRLLTSSLDLRTPQLPENTVRDLTAVTRRLYETSERAPDVCHVPMRLVRQDRFDDLLVALESASAASAHFVVALLDAALPPPPVEVQLVTRGDGRVDSVWSTRDDADARLSDLLKIDPHSARDVRPVGGKVGRR
jgi:hypothetical protein